MVCAFIAKINVLKKSSEKVCPSINEIKELTIVIHA